MLCSIRIYVTAFFVLLAQYSAAETFYELSAGAGQFALDITRKRGSAFADDSSAYGFSVGAYRQISENTAWGGVVEYSGAFSRDEELSGSGRLIGFRPVNYLRHVGEHVSFELYAGAAQYDWRKTANGYYFGANVRYELAENRVGFGVDAKYYQDLAFDSPEGDDIVDGFNTTLRVFYRFK